MYIHIYIHMYTYQYINIYIYICIHLYRYIIAGLWTLYKSLAALEAEDDFYQVQEEVELSEDAVRAPTRRCNGRQQSAWKARGL